LSEEFKLGNITFHGVISEQVISRNAVSVYPRENRSLAIDNVAKEPDLVTVEGIISDTPPPSLTGRVASFAAGAVSNLVPPAVAGAIGKGAGLIASFGGDKDIESPSAMAYQLLYKLKNQKGLIDVTTSKKIFKNMIIVDLTHNVDEKNHKALIARITLQESQTFEIEKDVDEAKMNQGSEEQQQCGEIKDLGVK
jgi:hypothetical protein